MVNLSVLDTFDGVDTITPGSSFPFKSGFHIRCGECGLYFHEDHAMGPVEGDQCPLCCYDQNAVDSMRGIV